MVVLVLMYAWVCPKIFDDTYLYTIPIVYVCMFVYHISTKKAICNRDFHDHLIWINLFLFAG